MVPGYTILVVDTNILLSSLSSFSSLVESLKWTVIVPLPVIMELDGLSSNPSALGQVASAALGYITSHFRSHSLSLKILTSKGNYLSTLSIRTEQVDFAAGEASWERNMDDLILRTAIWQDAHWIDRCTLLKTAVGDVTGVAKVVLLTLDRMCEYLVYFEFRCPHETDGDGFLCSAFESSVTRSQCCERARPCVCPPFQNLIFVFINAFSRWKKPLLYVLFAYFLRTANARCCARPETGRKPSKFAWAWMLWGTRSHPPVASAFLPR